MEPDATSSFKYMLADNYVPVTVEDSKSNSTSSLLSLLDGMGKQMERLVLNRMSAMVSATLSPNQFGFPTGKGTLDGIQATLRAMAGTVRGVTQDRQLCVLVTLDVKNAFNNVPWRHINNACSKIDLPTYIRRITQSYLTDRCVLVPNKGRLFRRQMTCDVPQSSILRPTLWNIFYDELLRLTLPQGAITIGFADDLALMGINHTTEGLETTTNDTLTMINDWVVRNGMTLAYQKIEAVMISLSWAYRKLVFFSGGHRYHQTHG